MNQSSENTKPPRDSDECLLELPLSRGQLPAEFGRYELTRVLGVGGMGTVYLARDTALERLVALKIPNRVSDPEMLRRLLEEARIAAKISHPNVCSIYDIASEDGQPFFTMEYVDGQSLEHFVSKDEPMSPLLATKLVIRIAAGLHVAHQAGVLHRDLKPANILVRENMVPVITDFGLALRYDAAGTAQVPRKLLGSPAYMSPEQVRCDVTEFGPTMDIYGLGAILYELIAGRRPFTGQIPEVYSQVLKRRPQPPSDFATAVDERLDQICMRALSKSPIDRFQTVTEFSEALLQYLHAPRRIVGGVPPAIAGEAPPLAPRQTPAVPPVVQVAASIVLDAIPTTTPPAAGNPVRPRLGQPNRTRSVKSNANANALITRRMDPPNTTGQRGSALWFTGLITTCLVTFALTAGFGFWSGEPVTETVQASEPTADVTADDPAPSPADPDSAGPVQSTDSPSVDPAPTAVAGPRIPADSASEPTRAPQGPVVETDPVAAAALLARRHLSPTLFTSDAAGDQFTSTAMMNVRFELAEPIDLDDAVVLLDGKPVDAGQLGDGVRLSPGMHSVSISSPQAESLSHSFQVGPADSTKPVLLPIVRRLGTLRLRIVRLFSSDKVKLDGQRVPLKRLAEPMTLPVGKHTLELVRERRPTKKKTFWVVAGRNDDLNIAVQSRTPVDQSTTELLSLQESSEDVRQMAEFPIHAGEIRAANCLGIQLGWCPGKPVDLSRPQVADEVGGFWIGRFEVTNAQWESFSDAAPRIGPELSPTESQRHVNSITWQEATDFAGKLTRTERQRGRINSQWEFALPTQTQWAFAISAGAERSVAAESAASVASGVNAWGLHTRGSKGHEWCRDGNLQDGSSADAVKPHHLGFRLILVRTASDDG